MDYRSLFNLFIAAINDICLIKKGFHYKWRINYERYYYFYEEEVNEKYTTD